MSELANEVKAIESKAEAAVSEVKTEVEKVAGEVVAEAKKVVGVAETEIKKVTQELTAEEKLAIREIENAYLKAQIEINRLSQITQKAQGDFTKNVEALTKKYLISPAEFVFDNIELVFKRK